MTTEKIIMIAIAKMDLVIMNYIFPAAVAILGIAAIRIYIWGIRKWLRRKAASRQS